MPEDNKRNILYFDAPSMRALFDKIDAWQAKHRKRLQSISIQPEGDTFACIALSNPSEVVIVDGAGFNSARVFNGNLFVHDESA